MDIFKRSTEANSRCTGVKSADPGARKTAIEASKHISPCTGVPQNDPGAHKTATLHLRHKTKRFHRT